nr:GreA/GreB family elongation factor [uncultured Flavobacterium sp.]
MSENIVLTTGVYDLIKDHVRRRKVTKTEEDILVEELKNASQVTRKELPEDVVTVDKMITVKTGEETKKITLVGPAKAKPNKNKYSVLSDLGIAIIGYKVGDIVKWPSKDGEVQYEILAVEALAN